KSNARLRPTTPAAPRHGVVPSMAPDALTPERVALRLAATSSSLIMNVSSLRPLAFSALAALSAGPLSAAVLTLTPNADNFIRSDNTGSTTDTNVLLVGELASGAGNLRSLLSFDLSSPELVGATINSVTLTLRANDIDAISTGGTMQVNLNLLDSSFTETGATWLNSGT